MDSKREDALVGLFVLVVSALLVLTAFFLSGPFGHTEIPYRAYFKNAGGLGPGTQVRYAGGPPIGRVQKVMADPQNPARMEIDFSVQPDVPVKTDSKAIITNVSPLGDNFLGIVPGTASAPEAPGGATLPSVEYVSFADVAALLGQIGPNASELITNINARAVALKDTIDRVNDLLSAQNRANIRASLGNVRGMLQEDRPAIHSAVQNLSAGSARLAPLIDDFRKTSAQADDALSHLDAAVTENRPDLRQAVASLRQALASAVSLTDQLDRTVANNAENLDEILDNLRQATDNLNSFTETIKTRPYSLIRGSGIKPRNPGDEPPK